MISTMFASVDKNKGSDFCDQNTHKQNISISKLKVD